MAVVRESNTQIRFIGLSTDPKPVPGSPETGPDFGPGTIFDERDTGIQWKWDGTNWNQQVADPNLSPESLGPGIRVLLGSINDLTREVRLLRRGMIFAETSVCEDVEDDDSDA